MSCLLFEDGPITLVSETEVTNKIDEVQYLCSHNLAKMPRNQFAIINDDKVFNSQRYEYDINALERP